MKNRTSWRLACAITLLTTGASMACSSSGESRPDTVAASAGQMVDGGDVAAPRTMASPTAQMAAVLDTLGALGGKPIETLTPTEARKQPTPADAAKKVMAAQGKPTAPDPAMKSMDRTIPGPAGALPVRVYTPAS